jgi:hypothetical protein
MHVVYIRCGAGVLFTCIGVRRSNWNGRVQCEMSGSEQTRKASLQEDQFISESRPCRTYSRGASSRMPFKYGQISECVIMPIEAVAVNSCNIICA